MQIRLDKKDEFVRVFDGTRYLTLFGSENMKLFTTELAVSYFFITILRKSKLIPMFLSLPTEKRLTLHNI